MKKVTQLPIIVTYNVKVVEYNGTSYVRTRDISDALGIKQPFEFTRDIRKVLGADSVLSGEDTKDFRSGTDNARTPYVSVIDMLEFLEQGILKHKTNGMLDNVKSTLEYYLFK